MNELESRLTNSEISPFELEARDEDYDIYLFWPSLNSGAATFEKPFVATHQRVRRLFLRAAQDSLVVPATSICLLRLSSTLLIVMRVGTRHPRCVMLCIHVVVRRK